MRPVNAARLVQLIRPLPWRTHISLAIRASVFALTLVAIGPPALGLTDEGDPCDIAADESACGRASEGAIVIGTRSRSSPGERNRPTIAGGDGHISTFADAVSAFCADAWANASVRGTALSPEVAALCNPSAGPLLLTPGIVLRAFRELPLYRGAIQTDPVGWTLVNLDTYFWCADGAGLSCVHRGEPEQLITLLGRQVRIRPHVTAYTWRFGDGSAQTQTAGEGRVTHIYRSRQTAVVTVTLTWSAEYSVGGGGFQPIGGTTTTTSEPLVLPVREARPVLIGGN